MKFLQEGDKKWDSLLSERKRYNLKSIIGVDELFIRPEFKVFLQRAEQKTECSTRFKHGSCIIAAAFVDI